MLSNTFCHIPRISLRKEKELWDRGILTWDDYRAEAKHHELLDPSLLQPSQRDASFFINSMKSDQHWRLFGDFQDSVAYVDIETTGLNKYSDVITTIALYNSKEIKTYVNGRNLEQFPLDISAYELLVTFNGKTFDVPFIENFFGLKLRAAHIDLRYILKRLGYSGGLKQIEKQVGINRGDLRDVDGNFAVMLWNEYKRRKNEAALTTLLAYNCSDVISLEQLMIMSYNLSIKETPFKKSRRIPERPACPLPFCVDKNIISRFSYR